MCLFLKGQIPDGCSVYRLDAILLGTDSLISVIIRGRLNVRDNLLTRLISKEVTPFASIMHAEQRNTQTPQSSIATVSHGVKLQA